MNEPQESKAPLASLARTIELRGGQADPEAHAAVQDNPLRLNRSSQQRVVHGL